MCGASICCLCFITQSNHVKFSLDTAPVLQQWLSSPEKDTAAKKKVKEDVAQQWLEVKASALQDLLAYQAAVIGGCLSSAADQRNAGKVRCIYTQQSSLMYLWWLQPFRFQQCPEYTSCAQPAKCVTSSNDFCH